MNDPWDVKSIRQPNQYVSCMKICGVPLLPPVLSRECRMEMQSYKLLAKEVENRISLLKSFIDSDAEVSEDKTDAPDIPESELSYELPTEEIEAGFNVNINKIVAVNVKPLNDNLPDAQTIDNVSTNICKIQNSPKACDVKLTPKKLLVDLSFNITEAGRNILEGINNNSQPTSPTADVPERDYDCLKNYKQKVVTNGNDSIKNNIKRSEKDSFDIGYEKDVLSDPFPDLSLSQDGPASLSSKSFTGSLIDIYTETMKESQNIPKLIRQRSYTLLKPSPQLLAHLEVQSLSTGVDMTCISMSESLSNLNSPNKKRRSWDLETAKVKWSSMALELSRKNVPSSDKLNGATKNNTKPTTQKKTQTTVSVRSKSAIPDKSRRLSISKVSPKSEPVQKSRKLSTSPIRNVRVPIKDTNSPKTQKKDVCTATLKSNIEPAFESEDPASRVRELYEKIQKQQLIQMANLVEKQKREQLLLQQVFEEQNNLLCRQLKSICPKSPIEAKEGWGDDSQGTADRGPVSLSQLINHKFQEPELDTSIGNTLTETKNYINQCDDVLKSSKALSSTMKKQPTDKAQKQNGVRNSSHVTKLEGNRSKTNTPTRNTSRRLNYDTSASSDREYEPILTDRTNDTMADLNVTFPTDPSEDGNVPTTNHISFNQVYNDDVTLVPRTILALENSRLNCSTPENIVEVKRKKADYDSSILHRQPTAREQWAASRLCAAGRGFLTRRLLRTERVRRTVRTVRDALVCALQLHADSRGIHGADIALHRRLIQQITAACYSLHETFVTSTPAERCAIIAADRRRRNEIAARLNNPQNVMSQSHSGAFPGRAPRVAPPTVMAHSSYETLSGDKIQSHGRLVSSPARRPWR